MDKTTVFTKTGKGVHELTNLHPLPEQVELKTLSLVNGVLCAEQICSKCSGFSSAKVMAALKSLLRGGLIRVLPHESDDPITIMEVDELDPEDAVRVWAEATRAATSLKENGFAGTGQRAISLQADEQVLLVDDDLMLGQLVTEVLRAASYQVHFLADSTQAISMLQNNSAISLVLLDVEMPRMDGFSLLRKIRAIPALRSLPVAMLTAHSEPESIAEGLRAGADGYILKPFQPDKLLEHLKKLLAYRACLTS